MNVKESEANPSQRVDGTASSECQDTTNTTLTTTATSSGSGGDDDDRESLLTREMVVQTKNKIESGNAEGISNGAKSRLIRNRQEQNEDVMLLTTSRDGSPSRKKARHNHHDNLNQRACSQAASIKRQSPKDDGSTLKVPGAYGSDRIVVADIEGGVPIKPATVVASRPFKLPTNGTVSSATGTESKRRSPSETSSQNQHHLLLPPRQEPRYHTIRNTLYRFHGSDKNGKCNNHSHRSKEGNVGGSSSGSGTDGTEDGYAGSVSSNENESGNQQHGFSSFSPSVTSSEEYEQQGGRHKSKRHRCEKKSARGTQEGGDLESSSDISDFGSSGSSEMDEEDLRNRREGGAMQSFGTKSFSSSSSSSFSFSNYSNSGGLELAYLSAKHDADAQHERKLHRNVSKSLIARKKRLASKNLKDGRPPIFAMGCDVMAHILTFIHPPEILDVLTMPLSKCWRLNFTSQPELWRVLCLVEPFKANMPDPSVRSRSKQDGTTISKDREDQKLLDKYRLLYTKLVRCMKYVSQIRDDAINGRPPAYIDYGISGAISSGSVIHSMAAANKTNNQNSSAPPPPSLGSNRNLQLFLAQARDVVVKSSNNNDTNNFGDKAKNDETPRNLTIFCSLKTAARVGTAHRKDDRTQRNKNQVKSKLKFGRSMITSRLYTPVQGSEPNNLNLPWSCAIYSIVNWMVACSDVEGLQTLCLKVLPVLLENEQHRMTAQHAGLADVVLRAMVMFSESAQLHIAAFHTIVLLARPHGGKEGMLFRTSMTADGIFRGIYQRHGKSGIAVMLDSMRRFEDNATLLAMSCWALVNIALVSDQKAVLVKLGGIQAITNAMYRHPFSAELQFRALFALINLVIPSVQNPENNGEHPKSAVSRTSEPEQLGELNETTEKEIIDELVRDVASLVVRVMKNFCSNEAILNRACLVLHNLSLTEGYHVTLLWTPQCYQMLEWCVANFRNDRVLQQSATGTLHRLQSTLASDAGMRSRFSKSLQTQQQHVNLKQTQRKIR